MALAYWPPPDLAVKDRLLTQPQFGNLLPFLNKNGFLFQEISFILIKPGRETSKVFLGPEITIREASMFGKHRQCPITPYQPFSPLYTC